MRRIVLLAVLVLACRETGDPVARELARLESAIAAVEPASLHPQVRTLVPAARQRLQLVRAESDPHVRLDRLRDAWVTIETITWVAAHPQECERLEAFEALWKRETERFAPGATPARSALAQAAQNRGEKLAAASLPYARVSSPFAGVYYLGEAAANLRFARFADSVPLPERAAAPRSAAALSAAANDLEAEMLALFAADPTSRAAIPVSARLKEMRELLASGSTNGAALLLDDARRELARHQTTAAATAPVTVTLVRWPYT